MLAKNFTRAFNAIKRCNNSQYMIRGTYGAMTNLNGIVIRNFSLDDKNNQEGSLNTEESDADFQPVTKVATEGKEDEEILGQIDEWVKKHQILLFMKGSPQMPQCGYSKFVVQVLKFYSNFLFVMK